MNLIGEHTDYTNGLALPVALSLGTTISGERVSNRFDLSSAGQEPLHLSLPVSDFRNVAPSWGRFAVAAAEACGTTTGIQGSISSTLPIGAGLSSSAALSVALCLALGTPPDDLALLIQRAHQTEVDTTGVPCGLLDFLAVTAPRAGHGLLIDIGSGTLRDVLIPEALRIVIIHSGTERSLHTSEYALRREECERAEREIGPLRNASRNDLFTLSDPALRKRAQHVITENERVRAFVNALEGEDLRTVGELVTESHLSLRDDFDVSTPALNETVEYAIAQPGVYGARLTGAGFGGCVVVLCDPSAEPFPPSAQTWDAYPSDGVWRRENPGIPGQKLPENILNLL